MSIPVKINGVQVLSFDITTDDVNVTGIGNVSSQVTQQSTSSLCGTVNCYECGETQCTEIQCSTNQCTSVKCNQVKCAQTKCTECTNCAYDNYCNCDCNDN